MPYSNCLSLSDLFHLAQCPPNPSMLLQMANFHSFLWLSTASLCVCVCDIFFIHSSVGRHLGYFHTLAIVNNAAMHIEVHVSFRISVLVFFGYKPGSLTSAFLSSLSPIIPSHTVFTRVLLNNLSLTGRQNGLCMAAHTTHLPLPRSAMHLLILSTCMVTRTTFWKMAVKLSYSIKVNMTVLWQTEVKHHLEERVSFIKTWTKVCRKSLS